MPKKSELSESIWQLVLLHIAAGGDLKDALIKHNVTQTQFDSALRDNVERQSQYEEARTASIRTEWTIPDLEKVMDKIALGKFEGDIEKCVSSVKKGENKFVDFLRLIERDPHVGSMYAEAQMMWAERTVGEMTKAINSEEKFDKPKFDTAKWLMSVFNDKFKQSQNAAKEQDGAAGLEAKLEGARKRVEALARTRAPETEAELPFG